MATSADPAKPVLKLQEISDLAQSVHENLRPYRIGDVVGYSLQNRGKISALFARKGFHFDPTPFQAPVGTLGPFSPEAVAQTVVRQIAAGVADSRTGKRFVSTTLMIEADRGPCPRFRTRHRA